MGIMGTITTWLFSWAIWNPSVFTQTVKGGEKLLRSGFLDVLQFLKELVAYCQEINGVIAVLSAAVVMVSAVIFAMIYVAILIVMILAAIWFLSPVGSAAFCGLLALLCKKHVPQQVKLKISKIQRRKRSIAVINRRLKLRRKIEAERDPEEDAFLEKYAGMEKAPLINYALASVKYQKPKKRLRLCKKLRHFKKLCKKARRAFVEVWREEKERKRKAKQKEKFQVINGRVS